MHRRILLAVGLAALAGCTQTPGTPPEDGIPLSTLAPFSVPIGSDPVLTSVQVSAYYLADPPHRIADRPALAAQTLAQFEYAAVALQGPRFVSLNPLTQIQMANGRSALRRTIGIRDDAPPGLVIQALTEAAAALDRGDTAAAEAALARLPLVASPAETLSVLRRLPYVREANWASAFALHELNRPRDRFVRSL